MPDKALLLNQLQLKSLTGTVVLGDSRGTSLGFPTANLRTPKQGALPPPGIYACLAQIVPETTAYQAILHVGPRPTFPGAAASVEVHLIDFPYRKLYGKKLQVTRLTHIRDIIKYSSSQTLAKAIQEDIAKAKAILNNKRHE